MDYFLWIGPSAYSDMIDLDNDQYIGLTWETNSTGCSGESCRTLFSLYSSFEIHNCWNDPNEHYRLLNQP